jgi:hypothetical protein
LPKPPILLTEALTPPPALVRAGLETLPAIIRNRGERPSRRFIEFFTASIRNRNTRAAYARFSPSPDTICLFVGLKPIEEVLGDIRFVNSLPDKERHWDAEHMGLLPMPAPTR